MAQLNVIGYSVFVRTNPPAAPNMPAPAFTSGITIQTAPNGPFQALPINSAEEFMAALAVIQTPGRLMIDTQAATLFKVSP